MKKEERMRESEIEWGSERLRDREMNSGVKKVEPGLRLYSLC